MWLSLEAAASCMQIKQPIQLNVLHTWCFTSWHCENRTPGLQILCIPPEIHFKGFPLHQFDLLLAEDLTLQVWHPLNPLKTNILN